MAFKDNTLTFNDTKIIDSSTNGEVMMSWEAPIMEKCAEFVCYNSGDILEIGFGMGICSDQMLLLLKEIGMGLVDLILMMVYS
jgi:hypothetical protein